jgi:hypothetical protein
MSSSSTPPSPPRRARRSAASPAATTSPARPCRLTDAAGAGPWQVSVDWGDQSAPDTFTTATAGALGVRTHTYAEEGNYTVTVHVTDAAQAVGQATFTARVADLGITVDVLPLDGVEGVPLVNVAVAHFIQGSGSLAAGAFRAEIDWGDGTTSAGQVVQAGAAYSVLGSHTYGDEGVFQVTVRVGDEPAATASAPAVIRNAPLPPGSPHGPHGTPGERFIAEAFHELTGQAIDVATLVRWSKRLRRSSSRVAVVRGMMHDGNWRTLWQSNLVQNLYPFTLGRPAGAEEVSAALGSVGRRRGFRRLTQSLLAQARGGPATLKDAETVLLQFFYREFLGRTVDGKGLHACLRQFNGQGDERVLAAILGSAESYNRTRG